MEKVAQTGVMIGFHAENNDIINKNIARLRSEGKTSPIYHGRSRPPVVEIETASKILLFCRKDRCESGNMPYYYSGSSRIGQ